MAKYKCTNRDKTVFFTDDSVAASVCDMQGGIVTTGDFQTEAETQAPKVLKQVSAPRPRKAKN